MITTVNGAVSYSVFFSFHCTVRFSIWVYISAETVEFNDERKVLNSVGFWIYSLSVRFMVLPMSLARSSILWASCICRSDWLYPDEIGSCSILKWIQEGRICSKVGCHFSEIMHPYGSLRMVCVHGQSWNVPRNTCLSTTHSFTGRVLHVLDFEGYLVGRRNSIVC
jgi:hypothetical protein